MFDAHSVDLKPRPQPRVCDSALQQAWTNYSLGAIRSPLRFLIQPSELEEII